MKIHAIIVGFLISVGATSAAIHINLLQDKPPTIVLSSAGGTDEFHYDHFVTATYSWNWSATNGGKYSMVMLPDGPQDDLSFYYEFYNTWGVNGTGPYELWEVKYRGLNMHRRTLIEAGTNTFSGFPWETGTLFDGYDSPWGSVSLNSKVSVKLKTGGKRGSKLKNIFALQVSATSYRKATLDLYENPIPTDGDSVAPQFVKVPGASWVDSGGTTYGIYPDNAEIDITPQVETSYYAFSISPTKYKSHFTAYVDMPDPSGCNITVGTDAGHAWWSMITEAPADGISRFMGSQLSQFLGIQTGYYPKDEVDFFVLVGSFPGFLALNDTGHDVDASKTYEIGFPDLISGLQFTKGLNDSPGTWNALFHNCVNATRDAGTAVGIELPTLTFPNDFGHELNGNNPCP